MRQTMTIAFTAVVTATLTIVFMNAIHGPTSHATASFGPASTSIMDMMRNARNLPDETFDAH